MFGHLSYFIHTIIFGGIPILILLFIYRKVFSTHVKNISKSLVLLVLGLIVGDNVALKNRVWVLPLEKRFDFEIFSIPIDEYIFTIALGILACFCAIIFLDLEQKRAPFWRWVKTIVGISSLGIVPTIFMLFLRFLAY